MYNIDEIKELIQALDNSKLTDLEITGENGEKLCLKKKTEKAYSAPVVTAAVPTQELQTEERAADDSVNEKSDVRTIDCPMVGVFYAASSPDAEPYVSIGSRVKKGDVVCIIEAMKLMNEVVASESGTVTEVLVKNGDLVEFGQPLFVIE